MIRRIVRDSDFGIRRSRQRTATVHIVTLEENIAQLRRDLAHCDRMRHLLVLFTVEKIIHAVRTRVLGLSVPIDRDALGASANAAIPEIPVFILLAAFIEEILRRIDLRL